MSDRLPTRRSGIPWHRRLGVRLTVLLAAALLVFDGLSPWLHDQTYALFGLPDVDHYVILPEDGADPGAPAVAQALNQLLFADPAIPPAGQPLISATLRDALSTVLRSQSKLMVLLDGDRRVVDGIPRAPVPRGTVWPFDLISHQDVLLPGEPAVEVHMLAMPPPAEHPQIKTVIHLLENFDPVLDTCCTATGTEDSDRTIFVSEAEMEATDRREARAARLLSLATVAIIAVLLATVISLGVTRRLTRLSAAAAGTRPDDTTTQPFSAAGGDEIAGLAEAMNTLRARTAHLLQDLADKEIERRDWVAHVSHDLRTPLTALFACLDRAEIMLNKTDPAELAPKVREIIAVARQDATRVQTLTDDLFEIARLDAEDPLNLEEVPPGELIQQTVTGLRPLMDLRHIELTTHTAAGLPVLTADGRRLMRALENLVRNAIDHTERHIEVRAIPIADGARFEVRDDGPGLPQHNGKVLLGQLGAARTRADSAGFGLIVTRKVAEAHGGCIDAANAESGGACVWFDIPTIPPPAVL